MPARGLVDRHHVLPPVPRKGCAIDSPRPWEQDRDSARMRLRSQRLDARRTPDHIERANPIAEASATYRGDETRRFTLCLYGNYLHGRVSCALTGPASAEHRRQRTAGRWTYCRPRDDTKRSQLCRPYGRSVEGRSLAIAASAAAAGTTASVAAAAGLCLVDPNRAPFQISAVELLDGGIRGLIRSHLDEAKPSRSIRRAVDYDLRTLNLARLGEEFLQILISYSPSQITHIQSAAH